MEKAEVNREKGYFPMHKFINGKRKYEEFLDENENDGNIELSLGLSLNGKFGVDPKREMRLKRSSSIANDFMFHGVATCQLVRTCSLPVETEEEWRKRKEEESLRRMEAKRKRMEKMKNVKILKKESVNEEENNGKCCCNYNYGEVCGGKYLASSGGSIGSSQGSGSSGISDFESQPLIQGPSDSTEARTPASGQSPEHLPQANGQSPEHEKKSIAAAPENTNDKSPVPSGTIGKEAKEMLRNFMLNMPCVSTRGDGPNGKKIEGFLYGYKKGEEVRIVCVCHGSFLSPAEFVKHAGGGDVAHPLRHIVINPSPLL